MQMPVSKITLGTVQLGLAYGVANTHGQPDINQSHELLTYALENNITSLDTARQYGNSEDVLGSFENIDQFHITTKFKLSNEAIYNTELAKTEALQSVEESIKRLGIDKIPILLLHKNPEQDIKQIAKILPGIFKYLTDQKLIDEGGISVFEPGEIHHLVHIDTIRAIQVPMNVFDIRLLKENILEKLMNNEVMVFIRSIYLQGLLLMNDSDIPNHLHSIFDYKKKLSQLAEQAGMSVKELAFSFVRDTPGVTSIVVGSDNISQLKENIELLNTAVLSAAMRNEIISSFHDIPINLITPAFWHKLKS